MSSPALTPGDFYALHEAAINKGHLMVTNAVCAVACGVGASKVAAVRKMLGQFRCRKGFVPPVRKFLRDYPQFRLTDAATEQSMAAFRLRSRNG